VIFKLRQALPVFTLALLAAATPAADPLSGVGALTVVKDGFASLDTPSWLPKDSLLLFADLERKKLHQLRDGKVDVALEGGGRGRVAPDGWFYSVVDAAIVRWQPGGAKQVVLAKAPGDKEISLNDLAISSQGRLYYTTLKDPAKGRLTVVDIAKQAATVAWDGENEPTLTNPNGVALSPDEKFLYVGISSYASKGASGVYRFPINGDGSLDVAAGKKAKWAAVAGPDGIAADRAGNVWFTAGAAVHVFGPDGKSRGTVKIPKGSGTNLAFGGPEGKTLYVTTKTTLYAAPVAVGGVSAP